jgi:uncharacterized membrane protein YhaH (DUF805 family)
MNEANPYTAPDASLAREQDELYQPKIFSFGGRIGRLRYLAYGIGTSIILMAVMIPILGGTMFAGGFAGGEQTMGALTMVAMVVFYVASIVLAVMFAKRRLNDMNRSGWWFLLFIVPLINLVMTIYVIFFPGTQGPNNFGPTPVANTLGVKILALTLPVIMVVGIVAAIAIPAYQNYIMSAGG